MGDDNIAKAVKNECDSCDLKEISGACPVGAIKVKE
jgi:hypothetical protein